MTQDRQPVFARAIGGAAFCFLLSLFLFHRANKAKTSFRQIEGNVAYISATSPFTSVNDHHRFVYLKVTGYTKPFEVFVGKNKGDFKPAFERMNTLKAGDTVMVYFDENVYTRNDPVNRLAYFIDKNNKAVFIKGSWEKKLAYVIGGFSLLLGTWACIWKKKKKNHLSGAGFGPDKKNKN